MSDRSPSAERRDARSAREHADELLADALAFEAGGQPQEAQRLFDDALNAERWAVYHEAKAAEHRSRNTGRNP